MTWYKASRTDWVIQDEFEQVWMLSGGPPRAAIFVVRDQPNRSTVFYFTPNAATLVAHRLEAYGAVACEAPSRQGLVLLVGDQSMAD